MAVGWVLKVVDASYWNSFSLQALWDLGVRVLVLRLTSGASYVDPKFDPVYATAKAIGFKVLAYHVNIPSSAPLAQFNNFVTAADKYVLDGPPVLDNELTGGQGWATINVRTRELFDLFKAEYGTVINYTRKYFWDYLGDTWWAVQFPLWVASYWDRFTNTFTWPTQGEFTSTVPSVYVGKAPFLWQFTSRGYDPRVTSGHIDMNVGFPEFEKTLAVVEPPIPNTGVAVLLYDLDVSRGYGPDKSGYFGRLYKDARVHFGGYAYSPDGILWFHVVGPGLWMPVRSPNRGPWNVRIE